MGRVTVLVSCHKWPYVQDGTLHVSQANWHKSSFPGQAVPLVAENQSTPHMVDHEAGEVLDVLS